MTIFIRGGVAHTLQATGREFIMTFDERALRLAPIGTVAAIGVQQYADLVTACRHIDDAKDIGRLIALTCPPPIRSTQIAAHAVPTFSAGASVACNCPKEDCGATLEWRAMIRHSGETSHGCPRHDAKRPICRGENAGHC